MITSSHNWALPGRYEVDIFLRNRHSDSEFGMVGYIHNFTKIVNVQDPVLIDFAEQMLEFWLTIDGELTLTLGLMFLLILIHYFRGGLSAGFARYYADSNCTLLQLYLG